MNLVQIVGQLEGDATIEYVSKDRDKKLYKILLKVPKPYKAKPGEDIDYIIVKA
ncbi:hypothetical protein JIY74_34090 [Vibrio harveyi]|nr:hypothetical protein [Vibrio harveyi]